MITLITGTPGAGKTAYAIAELWKFVEAEKKRCAASGEECRPVFVMGVPDLLIDHQVCPPVDQWATVVPSEEDPQLLEAVFTFPDGALVLVDEAQKVYRTRAAGSRVPPHVSAFEKHRHKGLDFWLITQSESLIDKHVRELVGKHVHLRANWSGRTLYEWPEVTDTDSRANRDVATKRGYKLPKHIFGLYRSASVHIKQSRRMPWQVYIFALAVCAVLYLAWASYGRVSSKLEPEAVTEPAQLEMQGAQGGAPVAGRSSVPQGASMAEYQPRLRHRPESAPLYDAIRVPRSMPVVAGCVSMGERCACYTGQGTDALVDPDLCREMIRVPQFNPWAEPVIHASVRPDRASPSQAGPREAKQ